jgi:hypothetical protein
LGGPRSASRTRDTTKVVPRVSYLITSPQTTTDNQPRKAVANRQTLHPPPLTRNAAHPLVWDFDDEDASHTGVQKPAGGCIPTHRWVSTKTTTTPAERRARHPNNDESIAEVSSHSRMGRGPPHAYRATRRQIKATASVSSYTQVEPAACVSSRMQADQGLPTCRTTRRRIQPTASLSSHTQVDQIHRQRVELQVDPGYHQHVEPHAGEPHQGV